MHVIRWLVAIGMLLGAAPIPAFGDGVTVADDEVFLDLETLRFGGPLAITDVSTPVKVAVYAPPESHVEIWYFAKQARDTTCPRDLTAEQVQLRNPVVRAGAPGAISKATSEETQKYVVKLGPFDITKRYCFFAKRDTRHALSDKEQQHLSAALDGALASFFPGDRCPATGKSIAVAELADQLQARLPPHLADAKVISPDASSPMSLRDTFIAQASEHSLLLHELNAALQASQSAASLRCSVLDDLGQLAAQASRWPERGYPAFDPLDALADASRFPERILDRALRAQFDPRVLADRNTFLARLWEHRAELSENTGRRRLRDKLRDRAEEAKLQAFLTRSGDQYVYAALNREQVLDVIDAVRTKLGDFAAMTQAIKRLHGQLPALKALQGEPTFQPDTHPEHKLIRQLIATLSAMQEDLADWREHQDSYASHLKDSNYEQLVAHMTAIRTFISKPGEMVHEASYVARFPLSVSMDLGVGAVAFTTDLERRDLFSYFGLALYLAPVYKQQPLEGLDLWRRVSFTAGITVHAPEVEPGVEGVLGDRMVLAGVGLRLSNYVRLSGGALLFRQTTPNPLSDQRQLRAAGYASLSLDIDVISTVQEAFAKIP
ncbi:MAG: hypothetical protein Tsb0020_06470 [Haliangiales bacterium]